MPPTQYPQPPVMNASPVQQPQQLQQWPQQRGYNNSNQFPQPPRGPTNKGTQGIPYAYGQLPANVDPKDPKSQHPIPGSFNRHTLNPKTQSFVPHAAQPQPSMGSPYKPANSHPHGGITPSGGSPHMAFNGYAQAIPVATPPFNGPSSFGMARQGSSNSLPPYHGPSPQHLPPGPRMPLQPPPYGHPPQQQPHIHGPPPPVMKATPMQPPHHIPQHKAPLVHGGMTAGAPQPPYSTLPTYGNPNTLPQKPPTSI